MDVATVQLKGRMTKDPSVRYADSGNAVVNFSVAVNTGTKNKEETSFFDVVVFGKHGESIVERGRKGLTCVVLGRLRQNRWEQEGNKRSRIEVIAEHVYVDQWETGGEDATTKKGKKEETAQDDIPF